MPVFQKHLIALSTLKKNSKLLCRLSCNLYSKEKQKVTTLSLHLEVVRLVLITVKSLPGSIGMEEQHFFLCAFILTQNSK